MCFRCKADPWYPDVRQLLDKFPDAEYGPAHIVFGDFNTSDAHVKGCLHDAEMMKVFIEDRSGHGEYSDVVEMLMELNATIELLQRMLTEDRGQND